MSWKSIDSAPKDGTPILAVFYESNLPELYSPCTIVWASYHPNSKGKECWRTAAICGNKMERVTHWMPLPAPPSTEPQPDTLVLATYDGGPCDGKAAMEVRRV